MLPKAKTRAKVPPAAPSMTSTSETGTAHFKVSLSLALLEVVEFGSTSEDLPFTATQTKRSFKRIKRRGLDLEKSPFVLNSSCITSSSRSKKRPPGPEDEAELALSLKSAEDGLGVDNLPKSRKIC